MPKSLSKRPKKTKRARSIKQSWMKRQNKIHQALQQELEQEAPLEAPLELALEAPLELPLEAPPSPNQAEAENIENVDSDWDADIFIANNPKWKERQYKHGHAPKHAPIVDKPNQGSISDDSIDAHQLEIEVIPKEDTIYTLQGNQIVELGYVLERTAELQYEHARRCKFGKLKVKEELRRGRGLTSTIIFQCNMCENTFSLDTENPKMKTSVINVGAVWGTLATGSTHEHLNELLSCMDIPSLCKSVFYSLEEELGKEWEASLLRSMQASAAKEKSIALEKNQVCPDGIPWITVYVDGSWSKRSYGTNYNALSGMAAIIGKNTGELLFIGVRNKYCSICARAKSKNQEPKNHNCYKKWVGSAPAMEADALVEGFNESEAVYGLRYLKFVGDGDSSVFCRIQERVSYGKDVKKAECTNHALKNYGKRLRKTKADTKINNEGRKLLTIKKINLLTKRAKCSIYEHSKTDNKNVDLLRKNLRVGLHHVFGDHSQCRTETCNTPEDTSSNLIPDLKRTLIYNHLSGDLDVLVRKTHLLIEYENNNRAERLMNIVSRFTGGKRLNLIQRGSYQRRVSLSGLRHNKKFNWHYSPYKQVTGRSPGKYFKNFIQQKSSTESCKSKRRLFTESSDRSSKKVKTLESKESSKSSLRNIDYGPLAEEPEDEVTDLEIEEVIQRLQVTETERNKIQESSVGQFGNEVFMEERSKRLTASLFGKVIRKKPQTPCHNLVKACLKSSQFWSEATEYGIAKEKVAISMFEDKTNLKVKQSGLWVDLEQGFLGASPDGIIDTENALVEVKCLFSASKLDLASNKITEVVDKLKGKICLQNNNGSILLKRNHSYYYQIQGQLNFARMQKCYFIVYVNDKVDLFIEVIERDEVFWNQQMLPKLILFYKTCVAPEIIRKNIEKGKMCVDPPHILEAITKHKEKKNK